MHQKICLLLLILYQANSLPSNPTIPPSSTPPLSSSTSPNSTSTSPISASTSPSPAVQLSTPPTAAAAAFAPCPRRSACVPRVQCPAHFYNASTTPCRAGRQRRAAVCCSTGQNHTEARRGALRGHPAVRLDAASLAQVARRSRQDVADMRSREARLLGATGRSAILRPGPASYGHFRNSRLFNMADLSEVMTVASKAMEIAMATRAFMNRQELTPQQVELGVMQEDLRATPLGHACPIKPFCPPVPERYRRIDGTCNNLVNTNWGTLMTSYARLLPPSYHDGIWLPRLSAVEGHPLPSPRKISSVIFQDVDAPNYDFTLMVMQYGQFLSHDITQSIDISFTNGSAVSCCTEDGTMELPPDERHYACLPITIPTDDPFYSQFNQRCMNFVRSVLGPRKDCTLGYAQQMNKITHFLDASSVYGSLPEQTRELRSFEGGRLATFADHGRHLLPLARDPETCLTQERGSACFTSGDTRTNQMVSLVVLHTVFMREHNRIADGLALLNPHWDDEMLFLEARQVVMAELQVITFSEFLPAVIGEEAMEEFGLGLAPIGEYAQDYDPAVEPSIINEYAAAAFRFGHSTVSGLLKLYGMDKMDEMIAIPEVMFQPGRMRKKPFMDEVLSTLTTEPIQEVDSHISESLTQYLFRAGNPFGIDLASVNIQRGRDHGLKPYNDYRQLVGLPRIESFDEFGHELGEKLEQVYASVDDVDLWVGGLIEKKAPGSIVGYTFRDIIADQFYRLKKGDRYFFENDPSVNPGFFTLDQLAELKKVTLARVICDNSDKVYIASQSRNVFRRPEAPGNEFYDCESDEIPKLNLEHWRAT